MRKTSTRPRPSSPFHRCIALCVGIGLGPLVGAEAQAFPGVFAGKDGAARVSNSTQVVLLRKGDHTVVTIWSDYEGPLDRFAVVLPVPADVKLDDIKALKRDAVDHLDEISAPRFHEFWEMDPCEPGEVQQEWERDLKVKDSAANFLGEGLPDTGGGQKLPPEMLLDFKPQFKDSEYTFSLVPKGQSVKAYLQKKGLSVPAQASQRLAQFDDAQTQLLVAEVAPGKVELAGARRALLSPIRFATRQPYEVTSTLGLVNSAGQQELVIYVLDPEKRYEVANYSNVFPPTNVNVDMSVKERLGDFYAGVHDALLARDPKAFLVEYAWPAIKHCGEPCPNAPIMIHELLSLGVDVVEEDVPEADRNPKPPELTDEEKQQFKAADKETRKRLEEQRKEVARRRALLDRNSYVITRLHHRYDQKGLPHDIQVRPAGNIQGGVGEPAGPNAELSEAVEPATESRFQVRFDSTHENKKVVQCDAPTRWRWGKAPPDYRGLRKTWTARDLAYRKRDRFKLADVIKSSVPVLGVAASGVSAGPSGPTLPEKKKEESSCSFGPRYAVGETWHSLGFLVAALSWSVRRLRRPAQR